MGHHVGVDRVYRPARIAPIYYSWVIHLYSHDEGGPDARQSSPAVPHRAYPDVPPCTTPLSPEAANPHTHLSLPTGKMGDASHRLAEGMPDRRYRAGSRSWPPSAVLPNRGTHNILPHNIRLQAFTLAILPYKPTLWEVILTSPARLLRKVMWTDFHIIKR